MLEIQYMYKKQCYGKKYEKNINANYRFDLKYFNFIRVFRIK